MIDELTRRAELQLSELKGIGAGVLCSLVILFAPISVHIVVAQDGANVELKVASADAGVPPSPVRSVVNEDRAVYNDRPEETAPASDTATTKNLSISSEVDSAVAFQAAADVLSANTPKPADTADVSQASGGEQLAAPSEGLVRSLSVEPGARPLLPADRPAWVGAPPLLTDNDHFIYVGSVPVAREQEADKALDESLVAAVRNYIDDELLQRRGAASQMPVTTSFIRKNLIDEPNGYMAELSTSEGAMFQKWVTVRVTPEQRAQFQLWHKEALQRERLGPLGVGLFFVLGSVGLSHMVLRRWHGSTRLPIVNHQMAVNPPERASGGLTWLWVVLGIMVLAPVLMLSWFLATVPYSPSSKAEVRVTSGSDSRTIIIND